MTVVNGARPSWKALAAQKRQELNSSIPAEWRVPDDILPPESQDDVSDWPETSGWLTPEELAITSLNAQELVTRLASGNLKSVDVVQAFGKRASAAHQLVSPRL
jgi:amidase